MRGADLINTFLPDELLMEIFHRIETKPDLDACALVCRKWRRNERASRRTIKIAASGAADRLLGLVVARFTGIVNVFIDERLPSAYHSPFVSSRVRRNSLVSPAELHNMIENILAEENEPERFCLSDAGLGSLSRGCKGLEKLSLIWCSAITSLGLINVAENCRTLKSLDLQGCYVGDQGLIAIGQSCKLLRDLNLRFCEGLTDAGLVGLAHERGNYLVSLGIAACAGITDISLQAVASHCHFLQILSLDSEFIKNEGIISVARGCGSLKTLKLQCMHISDEALEAVGSLCSSLEMLSLYNFERFTDRSLSSIARGCKKLRHLTLNDCHLLTDRSLEFVARGCTKLTHLEINGCQNIETSGLEYIGRLCPDLLELSLFYCPRIRNSAFLEVGRGCSLLQVLQLVDCSSINDDAIGHIAQGCRNIQKLHIRRCYEIGDKGLISVGENCNLLTDLSIQFCERVGDDALIAIAGGCSLQRLNVSGCHQITGNGLSAVGRCCPDLVYLDISVLQHIGDMVLAELSDGCPKLKDIVFSHCRQITDVGLAHLVKGCSQLETCQMVYCPLVTASGVATIVSSCAKIKKVHALAFTQGGLMRLTQRLFQTACLVPALRICWFFRIQVQGMERTDDLGKPVGICYRIFTFLIKNFPLYGNKQISQGTENGAMNMEREKGGSSIQDQLAGHGRIEDEMLNEFEVAILISDGNDAEKPETIRKINDKRDGLEAIAAEIPMEQGMASPQDDVLPRKRTKKSVTIRLDVEEINDMKRSSSDKKNGEEVVASRVGELEKKPSMGRNILRPRKPIMKVPSNINERSREFIEKRKKTFASDKH